MNVSFSMPVRAVALASILLAGCVPATPAVSSPTGTAASSASATPSGIPAAVAVTVDPKTTAVLSLDLINPTCPQRPQCVASLPKVADLLKRAREAKATVVHSITTAAGVTINPAVAALPDEPTVAAPADKFFNTQLDTILKSKGVETVVVTGTAANGAVLYTSFGANIRGYTVVVPEDTISVAPDLEFGIPYTKWQLLRQPGFTNPDNKPLEKGRVTLSRSDLIGFGSAPTATAGGAAAQPPTSVPLPALNAVTLPAAKTAVLALDLINPTCGQRPQCVSSLAKINDLLKRARDANATVVYSLTSAPDAAIRPEVAPVSGETIVIGPADKFYNTTLDAYLKSKPITHLVIVGTAAHGAVLYTSFGANMRGYTVIVPEDGMSVGPGEEFGLLGTKWQLLNQPGFNNVSNLPLTAARVTLSVIEGVTFQK
jgi:nicotinamidase-related amidase